VAARVVKVVKQAIRNPVVVAIVIALLSLPANNRYQKEQKLRDARAERRSLGHIAYVQDGNIWLMRADGSDKRLVVSGANCRGLAWNPWGDKIAFLRHCHVDSTNTVALYVLDFTNNTLVKLTRDLAGSAKRSKIVWSERDGHNGDLAFEYERSNTNSAEGICGVCQQVNLCGQDQWNFYPKCRCPCSTAGASLLVIRDHFGDTPEFSMPTYHTSVVYARTPDDPLAKTLFPPLEEAGYAMESLQISPLADQVAFRVRWNAGGELWACNTENEPRCRRISELTDICNLTWHPSGQSLIVAKVHTSSSSEALRASEGILSVSVDGSQVRQIVGGDRGAALSFEQQCWSHNGKFMIVHGCSSCCRENPEIVQTSTLLLRIEDGELIKVAENKLEFARLQPNLSSALSTKHHWVLRADGRAVRGRRVFGIRIPILVGR
jgi:hypothetical protein